MHGGSEKANFILRNMTKGTEKETAFIANLPLWLSLECYMEPWLLPLRKEIKELGKVQKRAKC